MWELTKKNTENRIINKQIDTSSDVMKFKNLEGGILLCSITI